MTTMTLERKCELASWLLFGGLMLISLIMHLFPALFAGLLVYVLVDMLAPKIQVNRLKGRAAKITVIAVLAMLIISLLSAIIVGVVAFFNSGSESLPMLLQKMAEILERTRDVLPASVVHSLPHTVDDLNHAVIVWLREHSLEVRSVGKEAGVLAVHILIGMIIGGMVSLHEANEARQHAPLANALIERAHNLGLSFRNIVFAQVKIAAINAAFTGIYLAVILPALGIHLPLLKTMIALTFILGLLPVVGNLMSNAIIVIVSLSHSIFVAVGSLAFLVLIHKGEYFLNARIIGTKIKSHPWEILLAMLLLESVFGIAGVVAAPIYYAYIKTELASKRLV